MQERPPRRLGYGATARASQPAGARPPPRACGPRAHARLHATLSGGRFSERGNAPWASGLATFVSGLRPRNKEARARCFLCTEHFHTLLVTQTASARAGFACAQARAPREHPRGKRDRALPGTGSPFFLLVLSLLLFLVVMRLCAAP